MKEGVEVPSLPDVEGYEDDDYDDEDDENDPEQASAKSNSGDIQHSFGDFVKKHK